VRCANFWARWLPSRELAARLDDEVTTTETCVDASDGTSGDKGWI
jgi:hypothetical protein